MLFRKTLLLEQAAKYLLRASLFHFALMTSLGTAGIAMAQTAQSPTISRHYGSLPLAFEVNRGQTDPATRFVARGDGYSVLIQNSKAVLSLRNSGACEKANSLAGSASAQCALG